MRSLKASAGYTFHQHYDKLGLINMNRPKGAHDNTAKINHRVGVTFGRVYDPVVGRFLSVDPVVGNPLSAQDYNGYSYCVNNPLKYTDPSGYYTMMNIFEFIKTALDSDYGGHWVNNGDGNGSAVMFNSGDVSQAGVNYNNVHDSWGYTQYPNGATATSSTTFSFNTTRFSITSGRGFSLGRRISDAFISNTTYGYKAISSCAQEFAESNVGSIKEVNDYWKKVETIADMTFDWGAGTGPKYRVFINDKIAKSLSNSFRVNEARQFYYNKYTNSSSLVNTSVNGFKGSFGLEGLLRAGLDPVEQFVGTCRINIFNVDGNTLWFVLTNQTSMTSLLYDLGPSWNRSSLKPGGNVFQMFIWSEPVKRN